MKKTLWFIAALSCMTTVSCTTVIDDNDPISSENEMDNKNEKEVILNFQIMKNDYTRAENEDEISSLKLAFYHVDGNERHFLYMKEAKTVQGNSSVDFSTSISTLTDIPNIVIAFANLPETFNSTDILNSLSTTTDLMSDDGRFIMSSARYYDTSNNNADLYYSPITEEHLKGTPIVINLDRVATKVTVSNTDGKQHTLTAYDLENNTRTLQLNLTAWDVIGSELSTYLIKQNGNKSYSDMSNELGASTWDWNKISDHSFNWAHSVNWDKKANEFPKAGNESVSAFTRIISFSEIKNNFGESNYYHETTRDASLFTTPNARPSIVLAGQYTIVGEANQSAVTLYRNGNYILTKDELIKYFGEVNQHSPLLYCIYSTQIVTYDEALIKSMLDMQNNQPLSISIPENPESEITPNLVTLQIIPENISSSNILCKSNGSAYTQEELKALNGLLTKQFGLWEVFQDGKCFFTIPIEHTGKATDANGTRTGSYGLVRNHHYNIKINNIEGFGHGVNDTGNMIREWSFLVSNNNVDEVSYMVNVNKWNEVEQEVNIPK